MILTFWIPTLSGLALTIISLAVPKLGFDVSEPAARGFALLGLTVVAVAWYLARKNQQARGVGGSGGIGGAATAAGQDSEAEGGRGGNGSGGVGGNGGNAVATGKGARAKGGAGGSG